MSSLSNQQNRIGVGRALYDPRRLPVFVAPSAGVGLKYTTTGAYFANSASFFTQLGNSFSATHQLGTAGIYEMLVDITGRGWLGWVLSASNFVNDQAHTQAIRFTVDGVVREYSRSFTEPASAVGYRAVLGGVLQAYPATVNSPGYAGLAGSYGDGGVGNTNLFLPLTEQIMEYGGVTLRFTRSLKIEVKASVLGGTAPYLTAACAYVLEADRESVSFR